MKPNNAVLGAKGFQKIHGQGHSQLWHVWSQMKQRCLNPNHKNYKYYGGRGISVCERWRESFAAFAEDMGPRPKGMTLDRLNNDGNYEPTNCAWRSRKWQANNQRPHGRMVTVGSVTKPAPQWAKEMGVPAYLIRNRIAIGWSESDAVLKPPRYLKQLKGVA